MPANFADDVAACAEAGCPALEVWFTKLEQHLETHSPASTSALLANKGVALAAAAYQGGLLLSQGEARKAHFDHYRRRLELCEAFAIPTVLLVADFRQAPQPTDLERAVVSLSQAAQWAAGFGVTVALEFRAKDAFCASLDTAVKIVQATGEANAGVCLDVFHWWTGPSKFADLDDLTPANLAHVQFCDVAGTPREVAADADRILPGDGDLPLVEIVSKLQSIGYEKYIALELMNPHLWQVKPHQVWELGLTSLKRVCDPASLAR
jgi:sugar phosphate isomerase/epimerase